MVKKMTQAEQYNGIIFDFNGTLFWDSEKHLETWREYSRILRGTAFSDEEMRQYMFGRTNEDIIAYAIGEKPSVEMVNKYQDEKEAIYRDMCRKDSENFKLAKGAEDFLNFLVESNVPRTIATMSAKQNVDFFIESFNLEKWFDLDKIVYDNGEISGKPAPDIYEIAAKNIGLNPQECIVIEDAISGIESAKRAGIGKIVAIESMDTRKLYDTISSVSAVISDFDDFDRSLFKITQKIR